MCDLSQVGTHGYTIVHHAVAAADCADLASEIGDITSDKRAGQRNALRRWPGVLAAATRSPVFDAVASVLGPDCFAVRAIVFDKSPAANWAVGWHQDTAIPVQARHDAPGFGPWSIKGGVPHVRPPAQVLEGMLTARLHLDDCGQDNGPLQVIPASHKFGLLEPSDAVRLGRDGTSEVCCCGTGGLLLMRPLLLHSSAPASTPSHRRVLHIEYASAELPPPLQWFERRPSNRGA